MVTRAVEGGEDSPEVAAAITSPSTMLLTINLLEEAMSQFKDDVNKEQPKKNAKAILNMFASRWFLP